MTGPPMTGPPVTDPAASERAAREPGAPDAETESSPADALLVLPVRGFPEIRPGDRLAEMIAEMAPLRDGDVLVVTQKVVSKAEGRLVQVDPTDPLAKIRLAESESVRVLRRRGDLVMSETSHGFVCANAGVDLSNVDEGWAALLPVDPDRSARRIRDVIRARLSIEIGVIVSDTFGRTWRKGLTDVALGCAGVAAVVDLRGSADAIGRTLQATEVCLVDELAGAAELVMGKSFGVPLAIVRGVPREHLRESSVRDEVVRPPAEDLFR
ncbi:MAG: coenzyme F420-0:L-glutamate ligase [Acidimicrobiaceae bacterium]|nr:coenzyme F420-0:L-glutamate ligase [Acidimicrobiaceae bacterium]